MEDKRIKYPWMFHKEGNVVYSYWDDIPEGWRIAFGDMLAEELDAAIRKYGLVNDFQFTQIKEKYGALRIYFEPFNQEISEILLKYEAISEHVCIGCGRPDVPYTNIGWILPICEECYIECNEHVTHEDYVKETSKANKIPNEVVMASYSPTSELITRTISIKEIADKIREQWNSTH